MAPVFLVVCDGDLEVGIGGGARLLEWLVPYNKAPLSSASRSRPCNPGRHSAAACLSCTPDSSVFPDHCAGRCWPGFQGGGNESQEGEMRGSALVHKEGGCAAFGRGSTALQQGHGGKLPLVISTSATFAASSASLKREVTSINGH